MNRKLNSKKKKMYKHFKYRAERHTIKEKAFPDRTPIP